MNRIGTTSSGGAIVEISRGELATLQQAGELLSEIAACVQIDQPAQIAEKATPIARKPVKVSILSASGMKRCTRCGKDKSASEFYKGHWRCKPCFAAASKERQSCSPEAKEKRRAAAKARGLSIVGKVAARVKSGGTFLPRERDESDRPAIGGRTLPVGGEV